MQVQSTETLIDKPKIYPRFDEMLLRLMSLIINGSLSQPKYIACVNLYVPIWKCSLINN